MHLNYFLFKSVTYSDAIWQIGICTIQSALKAAATSSVVPISALITFCALKFFGCFGGKRASQQRQQQRQLVNKLEWENGR